MTKQYIQKLYSEMLCLNTNTISSKLLPLSYFSKKNYKIYQCIFYLGLRVPIQTIGSPRLQVLKSKRKIWYNDSTIMQKKERKKENGLMESLTPLKWKFKT